MEKDGSSSGVQGNLVDKLQEFTTPMASKHRSIQGTDEKREIEASMGGESQAVFAETLTPEVPFAEDVVQATEADSLQMERQQRLRNLQDEVQTSAQRNWRRRKLGYIVAVGLAMIIVGFSVAAGVFCRNGRCSSSSPSVSTAPTDFASRGTDLAQMVNKASISGNVIRYPPTSGDAEELALQWLVEDPSNHELQTQDADRVVQRFALRTFYEENGPFRLPTPSLTSNETQWFGGLDECQWGGVGCNNETGAVELLVLPFVGLGGTLTSNLALFSSLQGKWVV